MCLANSYVDLLAHADLFFFFFRANCVGILFANNMCSSTGASYVSQLSSSDLTLGDLV